MLDEGDHPVGHEAPGPDGLAGPGDLGDLGDPPDGGNLHASPGARRRDLERLNPVPGVDQDLDAVALHDSMVGVSGDTNPLQMLEARADQAEHGYQVSMISTQL